MVGYITNLMWVHIPFIKVLNINGMRVIETLSERVY